MISSTATKRCACRIDLEMFQIVDGGEGLRGR